VRIAFQTRSGVAGSSICSTPVIAVGLAINRRIGLPKDRLLYLVHRLVFGVAIGYRKLRALLEIGNDRHRYPRPTRPMRMRRRSGIAEKVSRLSWLLHSFFLAL